MDTKPTFIARQNSKNPASTPFDALKIIQYYLSLHPSNRLIVNSPLYLAAVNQYNTQVKNTLIRPSVPAWFCGKVNLTTNELIPMPTDAEQRAIAGVVLDPARTSPLLVVPSLSAYLKDACLAVGTPGSAGYLTCNASSVEDDRDVGGLSFEPTNGGDVTCMVYKKKYFDIYSPALQMAAWQQTKTDMYNWGIFGHQPSTGSTFLNQWDNYYATGEINPTIGAGPMSGLTETCQIVNETSTKLIWRFLWSWHEGQHTGQVQSEITVDNATGAALSPITVFTV